MHPFRSAHVYASTLEPEQQAELNVSFCHSCHGGTCPCCFETYADAASPSANLARLAMALALSVGAAPLQSKDRPHLIRAETSDLTVPVADAIASLGRNSQQHILLVFDIDNTLLTMPQFLGSDQWFNHHAGLISSGKDAAFGSIDELLAAQGAIFDLAVMKPTQDDAASLVRKAREEGVDIFLLSARGPALYDATRRELDRSGINFKAPQTCSIIICSVGGTIGDHDIRKAISAFGSTSSPGTYRDIALRDGIMMVAGQDKGTMLKVLLASIGSTSYDKIVFVDDTQANIDSVAASGILVPLTVFHYTKIPTSVEEQDVAIADQQWAQFKSTVCGAILAAFCRSH